MSDYVERDDDAAGLAEFLAGWRKAFEEHEWFTATYAVVGLTNFGEKPVQSTRLAEVLGRSVREAEIAGAAVGLAWDAGPGRSHLREPRARKIGDPASRPGR